MEELLRELIEQNQELTKEVERVRVLEETIHERCRTASHDWDYRMEFNEIGIILGFIVPK